MNKIENEITKSESSATIGSFSPAAISSTTIHLPSYVSSLAETRESLISSISSATAGITRTFSSLQF